MRSEGVRAALMRGGTSKGVLFVAGDLPASTAERDDLLLRVMGSPDPRQVDGLGGAHPLTSKVGVVARSAEPDVDVDYLFLQVLVDQPVVSSSQTCGNILAAVGPFAVERGLVPARDGTTIVRVRLVNNDGRAVLVVRTPGGAVTYDGGAEQSGVPGTAAPVRIGLVAPTGPLLPTGRPLDRLAGIDVTCIDHGMPTVVVRAADLGCTGLESPDELESDERVTARVAAIRTEAVAAMGLDPTLHRSTVPKIVLVAPPAAGGTLCTRSFIPVRVHQAIGVLGAASVAAAAMLPGSTIHDLVGPAAGDTICLEHPTGHLDLAVTPAGDAVARFSVVRTARMLLDGTTYPGPPRTTSVPPSSKEITP